MAAPEVSSGVTPSPSLPVSSFISASAKWLQCIDDIPRMSREQSLKLLSRSPTAGGQYHWVSEYAPPWCQKYLSYITGNGYSQPSIKSALTSIEDGRWPLVGKVLLWDYRLRPELWYVCFNAPRDQDGHSHRPCLAYWLTIISRFRDLSL